VLARDLHAGVVAVEGVEVGEVFAAHLQDLGDQGRRQAASPVARKCSISRKIHGRPCAARPIMTPSAPV
jgi:hypothetical protein